MRHFQLSPIQKRNFGKILSIGMLWFVFGLIYIFLERGILGNLKYYPSTGNPYQFTSSIFTTSSGSLLMGLIVGAIEVLYLNKKFSKTAIGVKILLKTIIYLFTLCTLLIAVTFLGNSFLMGISPIDAAVYETVARFYVSFAFWSVVIYMGTILIVGLFLFEVSDNLGQGVLKNFLLGKYHKPREEERIFMFLDMKASTTIAEKLGHVRYFELLNSYYADMTKTILQTSGEIYKYVGDEIIISWNLKPGLKNNNCLHCFFFLKRVFEKLSEKYIDEFGLKPEFKAGIHFGRVTTGELGVLKKEIAFNGDVLNTTARIQSLCNNYGVDNLISGNLIERLNLDSKFQTKEIGECELRGRDAKVKLYTANFDS
jgi:adenylate cyclase